MPHLGSPVPFSLCRAIRQRLIAILFGLAAIATSHAQGLAGDSLTLQSILFSGNRQTREEILLRELLFRPGERYAVADIAWRLNESRRLLENTTLFIETCVDLCGISDNSFSLCVDVRENWYIYAAPIFELADRNFNVWWKQFNGSLRRVNLGVDVIHLNLTGRADVLRARLQFGYAQRQDLAYEMAQLPHHPNWGAGIQLSYQRNHEILYTTRDNRQVFYRDDDRWMLRRTFAQVYVTWRPAQVWHHRLSAAFRRIAVDSLVRTTLNPRFFPHQGDELGYFSLAWTSSLDRLVDRPYPFRGHAVQFDVIKEGPALTGRRSRMWINTMTTMYTPTGRYHGFEWQVRSRLHLERRDMGYHDYTAMGYGGNNLRGYELYVVDGMDFLILNAGWRIRVLKADIPMPLPRWTLFEDIRLMPLMLYGSVYSDHGYVHDPFYTQDNPLGNRWLSTWGVGLDLRIYYDKIFSVMWSFNQLGENGIFLQSKFGFR